MRKCDALVEALEAIIEAWDGQRSEIPERSLRLRAAIDAARDVLLEYPSDSRPEDERIAALAALRQRRREALITRYQGGGG